MSSNNPPDNWFMVTGTWGIDADRNEAVTASGRYSLELLPTAVATKMETGFIPLDQQFGEDGGIYDTEAVFQADSAAGGDIITIKVLLFDINETLVTTNTIHNAAVAAAGVWEYGSSTFVPGSTVRFAKIEVSKSATAFTAYVDHVVIRKVPRLLRARLQTSGQSIPDNTWTRIEYNFASLGGIPFDTTGAGPGKGIATIPVNGAYWVMAKGRFLSLVDGQEIDIRVVVNGSNTDFKGEKEIVGGAGNHSIAMKSLLFLNGGDTLEVEVLQSGAAAAKSLRAATVATAEEWTTLQIARVIGG
jgi:hypothetical protein